MQANNNYNNFLKFFPDKDVARPQQTKALNEISRIFSSKKKFVIACLPTGSGKSHIAASVARSTNEIDSFRKQLIESYSIYKKTKEGGFKYEDDFLDRNPFGSYILTVTKSLQDQYKNLFPDSTLIKGKSNYACDVDPSVTVNMAPCLFSSKQKEKCFSANRCPYYEARKNAFMSIDPILNYRSFISLPDFLRKRQIYICDEASDIESELVGHYSTTILYSQLKAQNIEFQKLKSEDSKTAGQWLYNIYLKIKNEVDSIRLKLSKSSSSRDESMLDREVQRFSKLSDLLNTLEDVVTYWEECEYIVETKDAEKAVFIPYDIKPLAEKLFKGADKVLMMSATISNHREFSKSLGISENDYEYIEIPSAFDPKKSPIKTSRKYSLTYKNKNKDLPSIIETAIELSNHHKGEKGLIHTHTNQITEEFKRIAKDNPRFLFREAGVSNEDILEIHKNSESDTILVSPSLSTGISLDDHLGRFQIILKAPYLPLSSKRIKKIFDKNPSYYSMKMLDTLIQMSGRCTRSIEDHAITYILDGNAVNPIIQNKHLLPKSFLERLL
jgi:ATP-dependent DNA helicase DinG